MQRAQCKPADRFAHGGRIWVSGGGRNHRAGDVVAPDNVELIEATAQTRIDHFDQIGLQQGQDRLRLRIAEAAVVLEQLGSARCEHQPGVQHTHVRTTLRAHRVDRRLQDVDDDLLHQLRRARGGGGVRAHAAGVRPGVALADALVVLRGRHGDDRAAIAEGHERHFLAVEAFLDDDLAVRHERAHGVDGGGATLGHDHALTGGETRGLDDDGTPERVDPLDRRLSRRERGEHG